MRRWRACYRDISNSPKRIWFFYYENFERIFKCIWLTITHVILSIHCHVWAGINTDLYYIQRGKLNDYALGFTVPVHTRMQKLHFVWESLIQNAVNNFNFKITISFTSLNRLTSRASYLGQVPYWVEFNSNNMRILEPPTMNITRSGTVPPYRQSNKKLAHAS